jgi:hypothetical protein
MGIVARMKSYILRRMSGGHISWFIDGLREGLASPVEVYTGRSYRQIASATDEMRSDWERIGDDFRVVIGRENEREASQESRQVA